MEFSHKTNTIVLKVADIDILMIPVVNWLNSFNFIYTVFCCEGRESGDEGWSEENKGNINSCYKPYISFLRTTYVNNPVEAQKNIKIHKKLSKYAILDPEKEKPTLDKKRMAYYCYRFHDKNSLRQFIKNEL